MPFFITNGKRLCHFPKISYMQTGKKSDNYLVNGYLCKCCRSMAIQLDTTVNHTADKKSNRVYNKLQTEKQNCEFV